MAGRWFYPPLDAAMATVGFEEVEIYFLFCQNTVAQYIITHPIMERYMALYQQPGERVNRRWRDKAGLDLGKEVGRTMNCTGG